MKKDINFDKVEDVAVAIVPEQDKSGDEEWFVYLINMKKTPLQNLLITSKGYGTIENKNVETTTLRRHFDSIDPQSVQKIEPILEHLFKITNEYWISYYISGQVFDKKYVFVQESIVKENLTTIPILNKKGIMIK